MPYCNACGAHLARVHRTVYERLFFADSFRCGRCGKKIRWAYPWARLDLTVYFSRWTRCVRCRSFDVRRVRKLDHVDTVSRHPLSVIQRLLLAPVVRCSACRVQFFDWRPLRPRVTREHAAAPDESTAPSTPRTPSSA